MFTLDNLRRTSTIDASTFAKSFNVNTRSNLIPVEFEVNVVIERLERVLVCSLVEVARF